MPEGEEVLWALRRQPTVASVSVAGNYTVGLYRIPTHCAAPPYLDPSLPYNLSSIARAVA